MVDFQGIIHETGFIGKIYDPESYRLKNSFPGRIHLSANQLLFILIILFTPLIYFLKAEKFAKLFLLIYIIINVIILVSYIISANTSVKFLGRIIGKINIFEDRIIINKEIFHVSEITDFEFDITSYRGMVVAKREGNAYKSIGAENYISFHYNKRKIEAYFIVNSEAEFRALKYFVRLIKKRLVQIESKV